MTIHHAPWTGSYHLILSLRNFHPVAKAKYREHIVGHFLKYFAEGSESISVCQINVNPREFNSSNTDYTVVWTIDIDRSLRSQSLGQNMISIRVFRD